jgi:hypothetical protein
MFSMSVCNNLSSYFNQDSNKPTSLFCSEDERKKILEKVLSVPEIKALYEQAEAAPLRYPHLPKTWTIKFFKENQFPFKAYCNSAKREIGILESASDNDKFSSFVFELTNAISYKKFDDLFDKALRKEIECEEFVKETERTEFQGSLLHSEIMKAAIKQMNWDKSLDRFKDHENIDFETVWNENIKYSFHAESYRYDFAEITGTKTPMTDISYYISRYRNLPVSENLIILSVGTLGIATIGAIAASTSATDFVIDIVYNLLY